MSAKQWARRWWNCWKNKSDNRAAQEELVKWQKNREDGVNALNERQAVLDKALQEEPRLLQQLEAAKEALAQAQALTLKAVDALNLRSFLSSDKLDAQLAEYVVLFEATPRGLAESAQQGKEQEQLVERLLADIALPHTVGMWDTTEPVEVALVKGENVLRFSREHEGLKGVTIRDFTVKPLN